MRQYARIALVFVINAVACKPFHAQEVSTNLKADDDAPAELEAARDLATGQPVADEAQAFRELEVVDCPAELCTSETELVTATPEGTDDLVASTLGGRSPVGAGETQYALAGPGGASFDDVSASNASLAQALANGGIDGLRAVSALVAIGNTLSQFEGQNASEKLASAKAVLGALAELDRATAPEVRRSLLKGRAELSRFEPLRAVLAQLSENSSDEEAKRLLKLADDGLAFFRDNLVSSTDEGKLAILEALLDAVPPELLEEGQGGAPQSLSGLSDAKTRALVSAARRFAGKDGFVNRGDSVRILPVVPRLVAEVADRKIAEGYQQGIAQLASEHPFIYRRWMRRPGGLIGRAVNKRVGAALSQAEAAKWNAVRQAGAATQKVFEDLMSEFGVKRYYLGLEGAQEHWDPDTELSTQEIRSLVQTLTGSSVDQIASQVMSGRTGGGNAQSGLAQIKQLAEKVNFPDGIPVDEVVVLLDAYGQGGEVRLPRQLDFRMGSGNRVEIVKHHDRCECYYEPQVKACIMTFKPAGDATLRYFPSQVASDGTCDLKTQCHANFVKSGRTVNLMKACGATFRDRATGKVYVYGKS